MTGFKECNIKVKITKKTKMRIILKRIRKTKAIQTEKTMKVNTKMNI